MLNFNNIQAIPKVNKKKVEKTVQTKAEAKQTRTPRQSTLDKVINVLENNVDARRSTIITDSELSNNCIDKVIPYLLEAKKITRRCIGKLGAYDVYVYNLAEI